MSGDGGVRIAEIEGGVIAGYNDVGVASVDVTAVSSNRFAVVPDHNGASVAGDSCAAFTDIDATAGVSDDLGVGYVLAAGLHQPGRGFVAGADCADDGAMAFALFTVDVGRFGV